jgi:transcriptional regulator with XRE-family HTH domain
MKIDTSDLAGLAEVAELLGVSRERVRQLRAEPGFPEPVAELQATPLWRRSDVATWDAGRPRRPGRRPEKLDDAALADIARSPRRPGAELAREYGVSQSYISRIRSGERRQAIDELRRLRHDGNETE